MNLNEFRQATRDWLNDNCPASMRDRAVHFEDAYDVYNTDDARLWLERAAERGWTAPQWPKEYGGGGLTREEGKIFAQEMADIRALPPSAGMGLSMIGPTLLEFGTDAQKHRHLPSAQDHERRCAMVSGLQRARRRFRPRQSQNQSRARRRSFCDQRPENLDVRRRPC